MSDRLPAHVLVSALSRRASDGGGAAAVLARGDPQAGGILLLLSHRGSPERVVERGVGGDGRPALIDATPTDQPDAYWRRRRARDPDLWVVALDIADAERLAAEILLGN